MLLLLLLVGVASCVVYGWVRWAREAAWDRQSPHAQTVLETTRKAAVWLLAWAARQGEKLGEIGKRIDHAPLSAEELSTVQAYRDLSSYIPADLAGQLLPWPAYETIFNRHVFRANLTNPAWGGILAAGHKAKADQEAAEAKAKAEAERQRQEAAAKQREAERQRQLQIANTIPTPKDHGLGPEFPDIDTFARWDRLTPSGGLKLGTGREPRVDADSAVRQTDQEFSNLQNVVSFTAYGMIGKNLLAYRFSHFLGNLSTRQMFFMKLNRILELHGIYDKMGDKFNDRHAYYTQQYTGVMFLDAKPRVEHFIIGSYGDRYEENFKEYLAKGIEWTVPDEHEIVQDLMHWATNAAQRPDLLGEFASRFVANSNGWASAR